MQNNADFLALQFLVAVIVAYAVGATPALRGPLIGTATNIPEWVSFDIPKIKFK